MDDRDLIVGDVLHVLKRGFVYDKPQKASRRNCWKYKMQNITPNSGNREVRVVVIPSWSPRCCKIVTVMWADEDLVGG